MNAKRFGRGDLLFVGALLLLGLALTLGLRAFRSDGREAVVRVDGEVVARIPLARDGEYPIESGGTVTNRLRVEDGRVRMIEANCPDRLCVRKGWVRFAGDGIVCLPNRVVVELAGADELKLDAVAG